MSDPVKCPVCDKYNWDNKNKCECGFDFADYFPGEPIWFYIAGKRKIGPIAQRKLQKMISSGNLDQNTLVWTESLTDWTKASEIEAFKIRNGMKEGPLLPPKLNPPPIPTDIRIKAAEKISKQIRPWVRYWARMIDYAVFSNLLFLLFLMIYPSIFTINEFILFIFISFLWVFLESYLLSTWGSTLGKSILKILVVNSDGSRIDFNDALKRSFKVWSRGMFFGIPIATFFSFIFAYYALEDKKITSWDKDVKDHVNSPPLGINTIHPFWEVRWLKG